MKLMRSALFEIVKRSNFYKILPINIENQHQTIQKMIWLVVRTVPNQRYPLRERDVLKFGKQRIKVREIVPYDNNNSSGVLDFHSIKTEKKVYEDLKYREGEGANLNVREEHNEVVSVATENEQTCRICLQPGELDNPLICPCKCTGSVRYIHLKCLRIWLGKQLNMVKSKYCMSIKWTPLQCEMCKSHYKYRIYLDNKKYYTVQIPKPAKPYLVLQVVKKGADYSKIFHFVSMCESSKLSIGRKKQIDIKLSEDISVSRHHANLIYDFEGRRFLLEDNKSKFGTLVQVKKNLVINPFERGITIQIGGELFTFETSRGEGSIPDYYDEQGYLNIVEKGEKKEEDEESDQNNQDDDYQGEREEEPSAMQLPTSALINHNSSNFQENVPLVAAENNVHAPLMVADEPLQAPLASHPAQQVVIEAVAEPQRPQLQVQNLDY